jgi:hypothetical protein
MGKLFAGMPNVARYRRAAIFRASEYTRLLGRMYGDMILNVIYLQLYIRRKISPVFYLQFLNSPIRVSY